MSYCSDKIKASINFNFGSNYKDSVTSNETPIFVEALQERTKITYGTTWFHPDNHPEQFDIVGGRVTWDGNCTRESSGDSYAILSNGFKPYFQQSGCSINFDYFPCEISISNLSGLIYKRQGECPITFNVTCDDDCPPGHIKCYSNNYPGYCCIPCAELAQRVNAMTRRLK